MPLRDVPLERLPTSAPLALLAALAVLGESLLENMRVKRSFTEAFSGAAGLRESALLIGGAPLVAPAAAGSGVPAGDFLTGSWDLMDDGFELGADDGLSESAGLVVDMVR